MFEIGRSLQEARDRRGLELDEVAAATMIRVRYLEALEQEQFELLPAGSYRSSFLREYAEFLGLDGDLYVGEYELRCAPPEPAKPGASSARPSSGVRRLLGELPRARIVAVAVVAAAVVGIAVWQLASSGGTSTVTPTPAQTHAVTPTPGAPTQTPTLARRPAHQPAATSKPPRRKPPRAKPPLLALTATRGNCWLSARIGSSAGRIVYEQTLRQGQTVRFGLRRPLWVRLGAPWNLDATIGRRPFTEALPARTSDILATATGLQPAS